MTLGDVRLDTPGGRVAAAPLQYCRRVAWNDKTVVMREAGADWSEIAAALNEKREARYQQYLDAHKSSGRSDAPRTSAELD